MAKVDRLFVPLAEQPYRWFESGLKLWELRAIGRQFTTQFVRVGRVVEFRRGYSTPDSQWGTVVDVIEADSVQAFFDRVPWRQVICAPGIADRREAEKVAAEILGVFSDAAPVIGFRSVLAASADQAMEDATNIAADSGVDM